MSNPAIPAPAPLQPVIASERIEVMDMLRGVALLGILLMNMEAFVGPLLSATSGLDPHLSGADRITDTLIYILVQGKFWILFSLLFGMGFAVMSARAQVSGRPFAGLYWRRALTLLGIGLIHALLIWSGDILVLYALLSFFLLAFRSVPAKWLPWLAGLAYLLPIGMILLLGLMGSLAQINPDLGVHWDVVMGEMGKHMDELLQAQRQAYGAGSYADAVAQRVEDLWFNLNNVMFFGPSAFGMFLLGSWFVKSDAIAMPQRYPRFFAVLRWVLLPLGLALMLISFAIQPTTPLDAMNLRIASAIVTSMLGSVLMALGYLGWVVKGAQSAMAAPLLRWLAPAGRMALTHYLVQSIVCTLIFYGYGLGYFEQFPRVWQVPFALALFTVQVMISRVWLSRFRFGPMEWLWRALTYLRMPPMRR